jgi:single-strand DNA-binding protein
VSFAKVVISGTVTSDPEKRFTPNNIAVTNFNLSVENVSGSNRQGANEPFTVQVTCWRNLAEAVTEQLHRGEHVLVEGKLILNNVQGPDGVQKKVFEVEAGAIERLPGRGEPIIPVASGAREGQSGAGGGFEASSRASVPAQSASYATPPQGANLSNSGHFSSEDLLTEDDIPF